MGSNLPKYLLSVSLVRSETSCLYHNIVSHPIVLPDFQKSKITSPQNLSGLW